MTGCQLYYTDEEEVLHTLLDIKAGSINALVGPSGLQVSDTASFWLLSGMSVLVIMVA